MVDTAVKLIIYRLNESLVQLVENFNNIVYADERKEMLNIVNINFFGWFLFAVIIFILGKLVTLYNSEKVSLEQTESNENDELIKNDKRIPAGALERVSEVNGPSPKYLEETKAMVAKLEGIKRYDGDPNRVNCCLPQTFSPETRGSDPSSVDWINSSLNWVCTQCNTNLLVESWLCALNDRARRASAENGVLVEFEYFQSGSLPPKLTDLSTSPELNNNIITTCRVKSEGLRFKILTTRKVGQDMTSVHYDLSIERLEGKLKALANTEELLFIVSFLDRPDIKLTLKPSFGSPKLLTPDQRSMEDVIVDIIINSIATATVDFCFGIQTNFPKFQHSGKRRESGGHSYPSRHPSARHEQRLLVKVIKATGLGGKKGCHQPYCVIEMDEPSQRFQTSSAKNTSNPFWGENFLFNLKNVLAEILFEIYDQGKDNKDKFLGLGIVGVKEIMNNPSQRQIIPLQSQPVTDGDVTGSLTVEFLFMEGAEVPVTGDASGKRTGVVETSSRVTAGGTVITTTTFKKADGIEVEMLTDVALRKLESREKTGSPISADKSTLIIHSTHRSEGMADGSKTSLSNTLSKSGNTTTGESISSSASEKEAERGRRRDRKSFIGTLRKRLSFRKNHSKLVEQKVKGEESISRESSRSFSSDRSRSVPGSRVMPSDRHSAGESLLDVPDLNREGHSSARSSISEGSGLSASSSHTYIHEKSTLVVETSENGVLKHYLVPSSLANRSKWKKKGAKLHIYNDHIFVAKHLPGSTVCQMCGRNLSRRPGKQGYQCRDCNLICHKSCHIRVESFCPHSTINSMDMEYVQDPRAKPKSS
ncbi:uncharacterized protein LOC143257584 isoform X4 [Tachypleus tridentatus]|uniref:uncharacterized protein LOC143257584 isoform X4 n=1 Tax=Tachypleus tridentatus TaxID=6853 RepID=UPI003FD2E9F7